MRKIKGPPLKEGEELILYSQGGYKNNLRSGWRLGHFYLTDERLLFYQPIGIIFQTTFDRIGEVKTEKQNYAFGKKDVISLTYEGIQGKIGKAWIIMADFETWRKRLYEKASFKIDEGKVREIAKGLDPDSEELLWYLWQKRHARIDELARAIEAPTHMDVLLKIREIINPRAEKVMGNPILSFERSRMDYETGEKVLFSWWLIGREKPARKEALLDLFDEGDHLNIIMELLGVKEE
ncbi:hypothetical protein L6304_01925, partial [bacterium]|nr:hypothetical protein [bacterium]